MPRTGGRFAGPVALFLALIPVACSTPQTAKLLESRGTLPAVAELGDLPFNPQQRYYCGPAALATVLQWSGIAIDQADLAGQVFTPGRKGTLPTDLLAAVRRNGRLAVPVDNLHALMTEIAAGHPVVVLQNLALEIYPRWHFAVAFGYDLEKRQILLRSGLEPRRATALDLFERTWRRGNHWALVVLPPDTLPASADAPSVLKAAMGLERAARFPEAADAYRAILRRWPDSFIGLIGLGNAQFANGDPIGAESVFRNAIDLQPRRAEAWNNLAYALAAQGRRNEAIAAALEAVRLAPGDHGQFLHTLQEVSQS